MEVYMEKPIIYKPTMMALVAKDAHFTSTPTSPDLPLNTYNITSKKVLTQLYPETSFCNACSAGTFIPIPNHVDHPMDDDDEHHHDCWSCQPVDLAALRNEITQTSAAFSNLLDTLAPYPLQINPLQPTTMTTTQVSMDGNNIPHSIGCWQAMATTNNDSLKHFVKHQPMDLLALQQEIQQFAASMQEFADSLASTSATVCSNNEPNGPPNLSTCPKPRQQWNNWFSTMDLIPLENISAVCPLQHATFQPT